MSRTVVYTCQVKGPEGMKDYVTLTPPEAMYSRGLSPEEIVGELLRPLADQPIAPEFFARNRIFVDFMHSVIAKHGPSAPDCIAEAKRLGDGYVFVIDQRTPTPGGDVPPEDLVGAFQVAGGKVVPGSYQPNPNHRILSSTGFFDLGRYLQARLLEELASLDREQ